MSTGITAIHRGADALPFVEIGGGNELERLQVERGEGLWIVENLLMAGSVHTLQCVEDGTRVFSHVHGANLNRNADGKVESVADGLITLEFYLRACPAQGLPRPRVPVE